jgi:hypothetical protein
MAERERERKYLFLTKCTRALLIEVCEHRCLRYFIMRVNDNFLTFLKSRMNAS